MMLYKAMKSFTGKIIMRMGEVRDISDPLIAEDLQNAGYIEAVKQPKQPKQTKKKEPKK